MGSLVEYIPFVVGAGLFLGAIFAGIWKGKQDNSDVDQKEILSGVIQDNYSMLQMSDQLRENKIQMEKVVDSIKELANEIERLREHAKDINKTLEKR